MHEIAHAAMLTDALFLEIENAPRRGCAHEVQEKDHSTTGMAHTQREDLKQGADAIPLEMDGWWFSTMSPLPRLRYINESRRRGGGGGGGEREEI